MLSLVKWKFTLIFFPYTVVQNEHFHFKTEQEENKKKWHTVSLNTKENTKSCSSESSIILRRRHSCSNSFGYAHPSRSTFCGVCNFSLLSTLFSCLQVFWWTFLIQVSPTFLSYHCNLGFTFTASLGIIRASIQGLCHIAWFQQLSRTVEQASIKSLLLYFYMLLKSYWSVHNAAKFSCHLEILSGFLLLQLCAGIPEDNTSLGSCSELGTLWAHFLIWCLSLQIARIVPSRYFSCYLNYCSLVCNNCSCIWNTPFSEWPIELC